jgi:hypothetical protein
MKWHRPILAALALIGLALALAGCVSDEYKTKSKRSHVAHLKASACTPAYTIKSPISDYDTTLHVCSYVDPRGRSCTLMYDPEAEAHSHSCDAAPDEARDETFDEPR